MLNLTKAPKNATGGPASGAAYLPRIAKGITVYGLGSVYAKVAQFAQQVLLARLLGPAGFGYYSLGFAFLTVAQWPAGLGLDRGVTYYAALYSANGAGSKEARGSLWGGLLLPPILSLLLAGLLWPEAGQLAVFFGGSVELAPVLRLFAASLPAWTLYRVAAGFLQSQHDVAGMTIVRNMVVPTLGLLLLAIIVCFPDRTLAAAAVFALSCCAAAGYGIVRILRSHRWALQWPELGDLQLGRMLRYSLAIAAVYALSQLAIRAPLFLLAHWRTPAELGIFASAVALAGPPGLAADIFAQPLLPYMTQLHSAGRGEDLRETCHAVARWTYLALLPVFGIICLCYRQILGLLGHGYVQGGPILLVVATGWVIYYIKGPSSSLLEMTGRQGLEIRDCAGAFAASAAAGLWMVPRWGAIGAAAQLALYLTLLSAAEYVQCQHYYRISPLRLRFVAALAAMVASFGAGREIGRAGGIVTGAAVAVGLYGAVVLQFIATPEDRRLLRAAARRLTTIAGSAARAAN